MRTTLDLPDPVFRDLKATAARQGVKMKDLVAALIQAGLYGGQSPSTTTRSPLPTPRKAQGRKIPARTNAQIQQILDEEDGAR